MSQSSRGSSLLILTAFLLFLLFLIFYLNYQTQNKDLTFTMLDVGQGDALFIESPTGVQVLFDAGPRGAILKELSLIMPPLDRSIDAVIITNPDQDHMSGLLDVLKVYKVGAVLEPGTWNDSKTFQSIKKEIKERNIPNISAKKGVNLDMGAGAVVEILFPDRDVSSWERNDGSVVAKLTYGETSIMLTGDATVKTEKIVLASYPKEFLDVDILKVGHHGSRTSTSSLFVKTLTPEYAFISDGKGNSYGHPHQEVIELLNSFNVKILRTDLLGTVIFKCDTMGECKQK